MKSSNYRERFINLRSTPNIEDAKRVAKKLMERYDKFQKGELTIEEMGPILKDVYNKLKINQNIDEEDKANYFNSLDKNQDRKITLEDLEQTCIRYLCHYHTIQAPYYDKGKLSAVQYVSEHNHDSSAQAFFIPSNSVVNSPGDLRGSHAPKENVYQMN
ncbi:hypothetical protein PPERSA_00289 [Pseudocohnilembus persalinus]|uniref:EF-hand domain-containing protein n=1 Tax=Pseudocohnilembus persalinus TaxID=266149 RepID=A0A0V0Q8Y8_PSEPJ|nr:hypothetical protein PPERSA_00289 [Pseudocohnilembus persalinus]|eukprot:KRW98701.1 hypothetical protein PPERSA_00289 [Pseudocohnilembus persalinus]